MAPPDERVWIAKEDGTKRPISKPCFEDKLVQRAVVLILEAIFERDFHPFSHGFRKGHSAHQALHELREQCQELDISWIVDADVSGFFDTIDRSQLREFLKRRVTDGGILRLIGKWLHAGVLEGGELSYPTQGTPQGGEITPLPQRKLGVHGEDVTHGNFLGGCIHKDFLNQEPDDLSAFGKVQGSKILIHSLCERSKLLDQL